MRADPSSQPRPILLLVDDLARALSLRPAAAKAGVEEEPAGPPPTADQVRAALYRLIDKHGLDTLPG